MTYFVPSGTNKNLSGDEIANITFYDDIAHVLQNINQSINLFVIKGHRPLTHHINSKTITTKMQNYTGYKDELTYNISYRTT